MTMRASFGRKNGLIHEIELFFSPKPEVLPFLLLNETPIFLAARLFLLHKDGNQGTLSKLLL